MTGDKEELIPEPLEVKLSLRACICIDGSFLYLAFDAPGPTNVSAFIES